MFAQERRIQRPHWLFESNTLYSHTLIGPTYFAVSSKLSLWLPRVIEATVCCSTQNDIQRRHGGRWPAVTANREGKARADGPEYGVLVATDRPEDADVLSEAFSRESAGVTVVGDGRSVLSQLVDVEEDEERAVDLLVLDLSLPDVDGRTVLDAIRSGPRLQSLPVVAIVDDDGERPTSLDPNATLGRPDDRHEFERAAESMAQFWIECVTFPPGEAKRNGAHR